ncbi:MAG: glycosyltransferase family 39 protein [Verrucomicrobiota bacterium JB024]|nr:glycosyltransferase family 39 protein [Verrucomicrobiota bacterium JB024]
MDGRKRLLLFALIGIASFYVGYFALGNTVVLNWFRYSGYWIVAATFFSFLYLLYRGYHQDWPRMWAYLKSRAGRIGLLSVLLGSVFLFRAEPLGFKTIMDDHVLASTAMLLHDSREAYVPMRTVSVNSTPMRKLGFVDKRPLFQPFLVSLVHDLTGFRPYNGIYLNAALTPLLLLLLYILAERLGGVGTAVGSVALFCSSPLLSYICAGGGMEPVNLFLIVLTCLLGGFYLQGPTASRLGAFALSGILLAQCRYESVLFVLPVGLVIIWSWVRTRRLLVPWVLILCPLLLIPWLWQNRIFRVDSDAWQMADIGEQMEPFGVQYLYDNFGRAIGYFFDLSTRTPNSWLLVGLGSVALLLLLVSGGRRWRRFGTLPEILQAGILFLPGFLALFLLLLCYGWQFDNPVIQRLSLPLHIPLAVAGAYLVFGCLRSRALHRIAWVAIAVYFAAYAYPSTSQRIYARTYQSATEYRLAEKFLYEHQGEPMVMIAENSPFFSLYLDYVVTTPGANERKEEIKYFLQQPTSPPVYAFRFLYYDAVSRTLKPSTKTDLDEDFVTEPVWEDAYSEIRKVQVVRIVDVQNVEVEEPEYKDMFDYLKYWGRHIP